jgi:hypothetical protein
MKKLLFIPTAATLLCCYSLLAWSAGGHFAVDDATLADPGRCQIEAWYTRHDRGSREYTLVPACNPTGNLELGLGVTRLSPKSDLQLELSAKTLVRELTLDTIGWGIAVVSQHNDDLSRLEAIQAYVPVSIPLVPGVLVHANLGWDYQRHDADSMTWGLGTDIGLTDNMHLIGEVWGHHRGGSAAQIGLRFVVKEANIDVSYGRNRGGDEDWFTVGTAWTF